jgi:uncharacterized protein
MLRGFALFGVVVSNVSVFAGSGSAPGPPSPLELRVGMVEAYLITGKFLALFSLLFGLSFGLHLRRCAEQGEPVVYRYLRRLGALLIIGAAHRILGGADILMTYAVLGVVLLLFRNAPDRVLIVGVVMSLALPEIWRALEQWIGYQPPPALVSRAERARLAAEGPYLELVGVRAMMLTRWWLEFLRLSTIYLSLFLLGLWAARRHLLERAADQRGLLRAVFWGGLALTAAGYLTQVGLRPLLPEGGYWTRLTFGMVWTGTTFVQAIAYGAGIALLWLRGGWLRRMLAPLVPAGRMALTNYLAASALVTLIVALAGIYGRFGIAVTGGIGVALWVLELAWSAWWLRRHRLGPAEWLWRSLTHGRLMPMRLNVLDQEALQGI